MKERERHLPDSYVYTSLEQTDHVDVIVMSAPAMSTDMSQVGVALFPLF